MQWWGAHLGEDSCLGSSSEGTWWRFGGKLHGVGISSVQLGPESQYSVSSEWYPAPHWQSREEWKSLESDIQSQPGPTGPQRLGGTEIEATGLFSLKFHLFNEVDCLGAECG